MRARSPILALCALACAACTNVHRLDLDLEVGTLMIVALTDGSDRIKELRKVRSGDPAAGLPLENEDRVFVFSFTDAQLVGPDGNPLSAQTLDALQVRFVGAPDTGLGRCGRCLAPTAVAPAVVFPGDRCSVPAFANGRIFQLKGGSLVAVEDAKRVAELRARLELDFPGECACELAVPTAPAELTACPLRPTAAPVGATQFAMSESGTVLAANPGFLWSVDLSGNLARAKIDPPFGELRAMAEVPGRGTFLVGGRTFDNRRALRSTVEIDAALNVTTVVNLDGFDPWSMRSLPQTGEVLVMGETETEQIDHPAIQRCRPLETGGFDCRLQRLDAEELCEGAGAGYVADAALLATGDLMAAGSRGHLFYQAKDDTRWFCDPRITEDRISVGTEPAFINSVVSLASLGDRFFACARYERDGGQATDVTVLTATVAALQVGATGRPTNLQVPYRAIFLQSPGGQRHCGHFSHPAPGLVRLVMQGGNGSFDFDADGNLVASRPRRAATAALFPELRDALDRLQTNAAGWTTARTVRRNFYRAAPGANMEPIYAPDELPFAPRAMAPVGPSSIIVFPPLTKPLRVTAAPSESCEGIRVEALDIDGWPSRIFPEVAIALAGTPPRIAVMTGTVASRLLTVDLEQRRVVNDQLIDDRVTVRFDAGFELRPGRIVLARNDGRIWEVTPSSVHALEPEWDDPLTERVELPPTQVEGRVFWSAGSASTGVGWLAGQEVIARVLPGAPGDPSRIEGYWWSRWAAEEDEDVSRQAPPEFTAVHAFCPDQAMLAARELVDISVGGRRERVLPWHLGPRSFVCEKIPRVGGALSLCRDPRFISEEERVSRVGLRAIGMLSDGTDLVMPMYDGSLHPFGGRVQYAPAPYATLSARAGRLITLGFEDGRLGAALVNR